MIINKVKTIGPRCRDTCKQQQGSRLLGTVFNVRKRLFKLSYITKAFEIGSKAAKSAIRKNTIEEGIKQIPGIYNAGVKQTKNKKIKKIFLFGSRKFPGRICHKKS